MSKLRYLFLIVLFSYLSPVSYSQTQDLSNESFQLPQLIYKIPPPENLGTGQINSKAVLYGIDEATPNKLFLPRIFMHNQTASVPENEFILKAYYHPAIVVDNINTGRGASAEGGDDPLAGIGWRASLVFRKQGRAAWQIVSDRENNGNMDFSIRQKDPSLSFPSTERFVIRPVYDAAQLGVGEINNSSSWDNYLLGNTYLRGYLQIKGLNNTDGSPAICLQDYKGGSASGSKTWIRKSNNHEIQIANNRAGSDEIYWAFRPEGKIDTKDDIIQLPNKVGIGTALPQYKLTVHDDIDSKIVALHDGNANRLRLISGVNSEETYLKQFYDSLSKPFKIYINDCNLMELSSTNKHGLIFRGSVLASGGVWLPTNKEHKIENIQNALQLLLNVNGITYKYSSKQNSLNSYMYGFEPLDFKRVFPNLVKEDENEHHTINYIAMIPVLSEAIKELNKQKKELEDKVKSLEDKVNALTQIVYQK